LRPIQINQRDNTRNLSFNLQKELYLEERFTNSDY
jgi:hypothetical protein